MRDGTGFVHLPPRWLDGRRVVRGSVMGMGESVGEW